SYNSRTDIFLKHVYGQFGISTFQQHIGLINNLIAIYIHINKSFEGIQTIFQISLKTYRAKLVVFPRHACKFKNYSREAACEF
ncbi:hypothetical protein MKW92_044115, partial [Papaver armeniacum]